MNTVYVGTQKCDRQERGTKSSKGVIVGYLAVQDIKSSVHTVHVNT